MEILLTCDNAEAFPKNFNLFIVIKSCSHFFFFFFLLINVWKLCLYLPPQTKISKCCKG
jgi:hypothetical protein